jgi:hypothetical protein
MPPKPRQLRAPRAKQPGNAFQALVDLPEDGSHSTFDGRDGKVDGTDENSVEIVPQRVSAAAVPSTTARETTRERFYNWTSDLTRFTQDAYLCDFSEERGAMDLKEYCAATHFNVRMIEHECPQTPTRHATAPTRCTHHKLLNTSCCHARNTGLLGKPYAGT